MTVANDVSGTMFMCPFAGCDADPFDCPEDWAEHQRAEHGVDGPI